MSPNTGGAAGPAANKGVPGMEILKPFGPSGRTSTGDTLLAKGQIVTARVLDSPLPGLVRAELADRVLWAMLAESVEAGKEYRLQVIQTHPRLILGLAPGPEEGTPSKESLSPPLPEPASAPAGKPFSLTARVLAPADPEGLVRLRLLLENHRSQAMAPLRGYPTSEAGPEIRAAVLSSTPQTDPAPGKLLKLSLSATSPRLTFQADEAVPEPSSTAAGPASRIGAAALFRNDPGGLAQAVARLTTMLETSPSLPDPTQTRTLLSLLMGVGPKAGLSDPEFPARLLAAFGLRGEAPASGTLAELLMAVSERTDPSPLAADRAWEPRMESGARLFDLIGQTQAVVHDLFTRDQSLFLPFPLPWPGAPGRGELLVEPGGGKKDQGTGRPFRVRLLLDLTGLGRLLADVTLKGRDVWAQIQTESGGPREAVARGLGRLRDELADRGFTIRRLETTAFPPDTPLPNTLAQPVQAAEAGRVDRRV
jgi:hypothetical protein